MKSILIAFLIVLSVNATHGQSFTSGEPNITKRDISELVSKEEYISLKIKDFIGKHSLLNEVEKTQRMGLKDWITMFNLVFPDDEMSADLYSPGIRLYKEITDRHRNSIVMTTIAETIQLPNEADLIKLLQELESGQIELKKATEVLESIENIERNVFGVVFIKPIKLFDEEIEILVPRKYQFISDQFTINSNNIINDKIKFNTGNGKNNIVVSFQQSGQTISQLKTDLYDKKTAEKYRKRKRTSQKSLSSGECNEPYTRQFETTLETGLPCTGGCEEETPFLMKGEVLIIEGNDCVLDKILMITDGIDYGNNTAENILETLGGVETFRYLLDHGIDIMIVDWPSQMGWIENNSAYFQDLIRELAAEESFESIEMVVGVSMGGPITRHALLSMEAKQEEHYVKNWVAGDSPLEGSNVSIGVQALAKEMILNGEELTEEVLEALFFFNQILDSPAAREMLRHHLSYPQDYTHIEMINYFGTEVIGDTRINPAPNSDFELFEVGFDEYGYPAQTINNISISDGSGIGLLVNEPGELIFNASVPGPNSYIKGFTSDGLGDHKVLKKKYHWSLPVRSTKLNYGIDHIDGAPGSKFPVDQFGIINGLKWYAKWSFASTTSALGIPGDPQNIDLSTSPFITNSDNPWENIFVTDETEFHSDFTFPYGQEKLAYLISRMDESLFEPSNFIVINQPLQFHFENQWGVPTTEFCIDDDVYIDGSQTSNEMIGYKLTLRKASSNQLVVETSVLSGSPDFVNITEKFLQVDPALEFLPINYRLTLEITTTACGAELEKSYVFSFKECCTLNPFYPPNGPANIWIANGAFHWDAVGGATMYRIDFGFPTGNNGPVPLCNCGIAAEYPTIYNISGTSYPIPDELINGCYFWSVRAYCPEIGWSQPSGYECNSSELQYTTTETSFLKIFPNPSSGLLSVKFNHTDLMDFEIYNVQGKLVQYANDLNRSDVLDISKLPAGIYFLKDPENLVAPARFVKE